MRKEVIFCDHCGEMVEEEEVVVGVDGEYCCEECREDAEPDQVCGCCGNWEETTRYEWDLGENICDDCWDMNVTECVNCGCVCWSDSEWGGEDGVCCSESCYDEYYGSHSDVVNPYGFKPSPVFFKCEGEDTTRYFGIEAELDGDETDMEAEETLDATYGEHIYLKEDGSLNYGVEIVSHPMTLRYHTEEMNWKELFDYVRNNSPYSAEYSCGLHIHVSRAGMGETKEDQTKTIANLLRIFSLHRDEIYEISRRKNKLAMSQWADILLLEGEDYDKPDEELEATVQWGGRYTAINLKNHDTVEFRFFAGVDEAEELLESLNIINNLIEVASNYSWEELKNKPFNELINNNIRNIA